jgi:hypothetical protein
MPAISELEISSPQVASNFGFLRRLCVVRTDERKSLPPRQLSRSPTKKGCSNSRISLGSRRCRSIGG